MDNENETNHNMIQKILYLNFGVNISLQRNELHEHLEEEKAII